MHGVPFISWFRQAGQTGLLTRKKRKEPGNYVSLEHVCFDEKHGFPASDARGATHMYFEVRVVSGGFRGTAFIEAPRDDMYSFIDRLAEFDRDDGGAAELIVGPHQEPRFRMTLSMAVIGEVRLDAEVFSPPHQVTTRFYATTAAVERFGEQMRHIVHTTLAEIATLEGLPGSEEPSHKFHLFRFHRNMREGNIKEIDLGEARWAGLKLKTERDRILDWLAMGIRVRLVCDIGAESDDDDEDTELWMNDAAELFARVAEVEEPPTTATAEEDKRMSLQLKPKLQAASPSVPEPGVRVSELRL